jgi:hypothetical protein
MPSWVIRFRRSASARALATSNGHRAGTTAYVVSSAASTARLYGVTSSTKHQLSVIEASTTNGGIDQHLCPSWIRSFRWSPAPSVKPCFSANASISWTARRRSSF